MRIHRSSSVIALLALCVSSFAQITVTPSGGVNLAAPGAIGGTTPGAGAFTTLSTSSTYTLGANQKIQLTDSATSQIQSTAGASLRWANGALQAYDASSVANWRVVSGTLRLSSGTLLGWASGSSDATSEDTTLSRSSAGVLQFGTTTANASGSWTATNGTLSGNLATSAAAPTIASAATIAPVTRIVFVSGTTTVNTITAPAPISAGGGQITIIPTGIFATGTSGNIALASTSVVSKALIMTYDATTTKWYPSY